MNPSDNPSLERFQLSSHQRRLWLREDHAALCTQAAIHIEGQCDRQLLQAALRRIVARHQILRTAFQTVPGMAMPLQAVSDNADFFWSERDLNESNALGAISVEERRHENRIGQTPVLRALFLAEKEGSSYLLLTLPALCGDPGAMNTLVHELAETYGGTEDKEDEVVQYAQFSEWHHSLLEEEDVLSGCTYWHEQVGRVPQSPLRFPFEPGAAPAKGVATEVLSLPLGPAISGKLKALADENGTTLQTILLASWLALLSRFSGQ